MAEEGCWGPTCDFTGSKAHSDANPGRCTKTGGYLAYAEIMEILKQEDGVRTFHDGNSNTDVMLFKGVWTVIHPFCFILSAWLR